MQDVSRSMAASGKSPYRYDKEIDALLNRLHSGCRFIDFEEIINHGKVRDDACHTTCNRLRNSSPSDEAHADLGRGLAHSYIESLRPRLTSSPNENYGYTQFAIERGERIIQSLCCGADAATKSGGQLRMIQLNYASTACAFFGTLRSSCLSHGREDDDSVREFVRKQWQNWCIRCEELVLETDGTPSEEGGGGVHVLYACLKGYCHICHQGKQCSSAELGIDRVYESLVNHSSRKYLIRMSVAHSFTSTESNSDESVDCVVDNLSPLFHSCVLRAKKSTRSICQHAERQLILREILKACSKRLRDATIIKVMPIEIDDIAISQIAKMTMYLTSSLESYITQIIHAAFSKVSPNGLQQIDLFELGYEWLGEICDLMTCLLLVEVNNVCLLSVKTSNDAVDAMSTSIERILAVILPQFATSSTATFDLTPVYSSLLSCINSLTRIRPLNTIGNSTITLRLGSIALNLQDDSEVKLMIDLILSTLWSLEDTGDSNDMLFIGGIVTALGCIFRCRPICFHNATQLHERGNLLLGRVHCRMDDQECKGESDGMHLMEIIACAMDGEDFPALLNIITASVGSPSISTDRWQNRPLLLSDQCTGLLLGLSLLHMSSRCPQYSTQTDHAFAFLRSMLQVYPRLASRAVPSFIDAARTCLSQSSMTHKLLDVLQFLSTPCIVSDPHSAQMAWLFLSSLAEEGVPPAVRSHVIRFLPGLCSSNKRLTRRVLDSIGMSMVAHDPIIRLSATAALSDLAKLDLIRDVEPIIGLVQNRLIDDDPAVCYYALEALRYFVVSDELEFDLVVRVLEKRLGISLSSVETVLGLHKLVLEGLVGLLGHGGLQEEDDDDDGGGPPIVTSQSIKAVTLLVELALSPQLSIESSLGQDDDEDFHAKVRIQKRIYSSLARYSAVILGLDSEIVRSWDGVNLSSEDSNDMSSEIKRYLFLREIVMRGLDFGAILCEKRESESNVDGVEKDILISATIIGKTLLEFEEDVHGSFLFRSSGHVSTEKLSKGKSERQSRVSKSILSSLPETSRIRVIYEIEHRSSAAAAILYSIGANSSASLETAIVLTQISECIGDVQNESIEPFYQSLHVSSIIHSMNLLWKSIQGAEVSMQEELLNQVVAQMEEWSGMYGEYAYVFMAAFILAVDDTAFCWVGTTKVQTTILEGQHNYLFESEDTKYLCLGIVAASLCRNSDARVTGLIDSIEQYLLGNGRQTAFGALFGLGIINKYLMTRDMGGTDPSIIWRKQQAQRIICTLLTSFTSCLTQESEVVISLASAVKSGSEVKDLLQSCSDLDGVLIRDGFAQKMRACLIGIGSSFPVLSSISPDLVKCILFVVDKLPWGSGKGYVLPAAYRAALDSGVLEKKELSEAMLATSIFVQKNSSGVGDALLSLASLCHVSDKIQGEIDFVANKCQEILQNKDASAAGDDRLLTIIAGCAVIGELPGLAVSLSLGKNLKKAVDMSRLDRLGPAKKNFVASFVEILEEVTSNDAEEPKYRDASTICLGFLCAMSTCISQAQTKVSGNMLESIQAKDGSLMQCILKEVEQAYTLLCAVSQPENVRKVAITKKLCALFSALESVALPGGFSRVIEQTLNVSSINAMKLKDSSLKLLASQLESRRRIGFDGRGFIDLSTRLAKMQSNDLKARVGTAITIMIMCLPNLIHQIPTSIGEEVVTSLWAACRDDLRLSSSPQSMIEFFIGMKRIFASVNDTAGDGKDSSKKSLSPALQRTLQKFIDVDVFSHLCNDAAPSNHTGTSTENVWAAYLSCLQIIPGASFAVTDVLNGNITLTNVFGMANRLVLSAKAARKVEYWISLQEMKDVSLPDRRILLLSVLTIVTHRWDVNEMKESIMALLEVILVKGIDTMSFYLLAAKVAFWWESREVHQLKLVDLPTQRVSDMSSFYLTVKLNFDAIDLTPTLLFRLFDAFISDLPAKLAVLCGIWKMSEDVSNRASRILSASLSEKGSGDLSGHYRNHALSCLRGIIQLIDGGEID